MSWMLGLRHRLRTALHRRAADEETRAELEDHIARQAAKHQREGMRADEARRLATLELGGEQHWREATADARRGRWLEDVGADARYAVRGLVARPGFTLSALATLAVGIGAGATIIALADGALLRPLPFPNAARVMSVTLRMPIPATGQMIDMVWSYPKYEILRDRQDVFAATALRSDETLTVLGGDGAERVPGETAGASYFDILGVRPSFGRTYTPDEDRVGGDNAVVVISDAFWRARFGARPDVLGEGVVIGGVRHAVIGVMPPGFTGLSGDAQLWIPIPSARDVRFLREWGAHNLEVVALRADGVAPAQARTATEVLGKVIDETYPVSDGHWGATAYEFAALRTNPTIRRSLQLMGIAAALLVLIVFANLTILLITRGAGRRLELAIRLALGGGRGRLARQLVTESLVLAVPGGAAGLLIALFATRSLAAMLPASMPTTTVGTDLTRLTFSGIHLDTRSIGFAAVLILVIGVTAGLLSAIRVSRAGTVDTLRQSSAAADAGRGGASTRRALVIMQVALGLVFLVASGITLESFRRVQSVPLGWQPDGLAFVRVTLDPVRSEAGDPAPLWNEIITGIEALPGVRAVALGSCSPIGMHCEGTSITPVGHGPGQVMFLRTSPGYLEAVGTRVVRGRDFVPSDTGVNSAMLVNEAAARVLWGGDDPLVTPVESPSRASGVTPVIGIVEDARYGDVEQEPQPTIYVPFSARRGVIFVRADGDPAALVAPIGRAIREAGAGHARGTVQVMQRRLSEATVRNRLAAQVFAEFALGALLLASIGVYGTLALGVAQRSRELAIRRALGATTSSVMRLIGRETAWIAVGGTMAGIAGGLALNRILAAILYDVQVVEPRVYAVSGGVLLLALACAATLPMLRSLRVDPRDAMRAE